MTRWWDDDPDDPWLPPVACRVRCDRQGCRTSVQVDVTGMDRALRALVAAGWLVTVAEGERCPACVRAGLVDPRVKRWRPVDDVPVPARYL